MPEAAELIAARAIVALRLDLLGWDTATVEAVPPETLVIGLPAQAEKMAADVITRPGALSVVPVPPEYDQQVLDGAALPPGMPIEAILDETGIAAASVGRTQTGSWAIDLRLTQAAATAFDAHAADHVGRRVAILLDDVVASAPVLNEPAYQGRAQISGDFTDEEARALAAVLGGGRLPVGLEITEESVAAGGGCLP
jgi:preprotein translocase subunit SecD